jgi:hypothetical protein
VNGHFGEIEIRIPWTVRLIRKTARIGCPHDYCPAEPGARMPFHGADSPMRRPERQAGKSRLTALSHSFTRETYCTRDQFTPRSEDLFTYHITYHAGMASGLFRPISRVFRGHPKEGFLADFGRLFGVPEGYVVSANDGDFCLFRREKRKGCSGSATR